MLREFLEYRRSAVALAQKGTREYLFAPGKDAARAHRLARLLAAQGIQVKQSDEALQVGAGRCRREPTSCRSANRLDGSPATCSILTSKWTSAFLKEQDRRRKARLNDQIYDVTAWSLPLMFDVDIVASDRASSVRTRDVRPDEEMPAPVIATPATCGRLPHAVGFRRGRRVDRGAPAGDPHHHRRRSRSPTADASIRSARLSFASPATPKEARRTSRRSRSATAPS